MSKENFLANAGSWLDMLKFKASWGVQGNDNLFNYYPYLDQYDITYSETTGEYAKTLTYKGNEEITWETSYSFNTGFDFGFFGDRLGGTIEYFNRTTKDLLYNQKVPNSSGITTGYIPTNVGSIVNQGLELDLYGTLISHRNFLWTVNFNLTYLSNKIVDLEENVKAQGGIKESSRIYKIGGSLYQAYYKRFAGVDPETGEALYYVEERHNDQMAFNLNSTLKHSFNKHGAIHECLPVIALLEQHAAHIFQCGLRHHALLHFRGPQFHPVFIAAGLDDSILLSVRQLSGRQTDIDAAHLTEAIQKGQVLRGGRVTFHREGAAIGIAKNVITGIEPDCCRGDHVQKVLLPRRRTFRSGLSFFLLFFLSHFFSPPFLHPHPPPLSPPPHSGNTPTAAA